MDTMKDTKMQPATDAVINELRMLAEDLYVNGYNRYSSAMSKAADKIEQLRAEIEAMERQAPVAWTTKLALEHRASPLGFRVSSVNIWGEKGVPLYALPGAQTQGEEK